MLRLYPGLLRLMPNSSDSIQEIAVCEQPSDTDSIFQIPSDLFRFQKNFIHLMLAKDMGRRYTL